MNANRLRLGSYDLLKRKTSVRKGGLYVDAAVQMAASFTDMTVTLLYKALIAGNGDDLGARTIAAIG